MALSHEAMTRRAASNWPVLGALGLVGLTVAALTLSRSRPVRRQQRGDRRSNFAAYLRDHLTGADAAIHLVGRLREAHRSTPEGAVFASLYEQFREDRADVEALLDDLHESRLSIKRVAGRATGTALRAVSGGQPGDLSLFRTMEALAIGVQGKRCLWRAAQRLATQPPARGRRSFVELEAAAVSQWEQIERYRGALVPRTFAR
jgi:hypothetical protein